MSEETQQPEESKRPETPTPPPSHLVEIYDPKTGNTVPILRLNFDPSKHVRAEHAQAFRDWCEGVGDWPPGSGGNVRDEPVDPAAVAYPLPLFAPPRRDVPGRELASAFSVPGVAEEIPGEPGEGVQVGGFVDENDTPPVTGGRRRR